MAPFSPSLSFGLTVDLRRTLELGDSAVDCDLGPPLEGPPATLRVDLSAEGFPCQGRGRCWGDLNIFLPASYTDEMDLLTQGAMSLVLCRLLGGGPA